MEQQNQQPVQKEAIDENGFQPPKKPLFTNKRTILFILAAIVIGLFISVSIFFIDFYISHWPMKSSVPSIRPQQVIQDETPRQTQPQDFQDWQTYRNDEFGFEVRYP